MRACKRAVHGAEVLGHAARLAVALALFGGALVFARPANAEDFDRTMAVAPGTRLDVRLYGGTIVVRAWDRDAVRVRATHFRTDSIDVRPTAQSLVVRARSRVGTPHAIDFDIDVPAWMDVALAGTYLDISVTGTRANVTAATVRGDVRVHGGAGAVTLKSIEGEVALEEGEGRADLTAVNNDVRVTGWKGDVVADTVNGSVKLQAVQASLVEVGTVDGDIAWNGAIADKGRYQFATHNGDIDVMVPASESAAVSVRAFEGRFRTTFPVKVPDDRGLRRPFSFVVGSGAARLDLETFGGTISLRHGT